MPLFISKCGQLCELSLLALLLFMSHCLCVSVWEIKTGQEKRNVSSVSCLCETNDRGCHVDSRVCVHKEVREEKDADLGLALINVPVCVWAFITHVAWTKICSHSHIVMG